MKRIFIAISIISSTVLLKAQTGRLTTEDRQISDSVKKDTAWKFGGVLAFTFTQTGFTEWASGGQNSLVLNSKAVLSANYAKNKSTWKNTLNMAYGTSKQGDQDNRKINDIIEINSKYGYKASKKWNYSALLTARTQFSDGFEYPSTDSSVLVSRAFAPFELILALGMEYNPNKFLSVFISPLNFNSVYVKDTIFSKRYSIDAGEHVRNDIGFLIRTSFEKEVVKNLNITSVLDLSGAYERLNGLDDVDVDWEILATYNVFKVLAINLNTHLIWDKDVRFDDGEGGTEARLQFMEIFGAGITYKF